MKSRSTARERTDRPPSELAVLIETETRLDRALADARSTATALCDAARARAAANVAALNAELVAEHARIANEIAATTRAEIAKIEDEARIIVARCESVRGDSQQRIADQLGEQLVALVIEETSS